MCCSGNGPKWKREVVKDHKFDYIDIDEFYDPSCCGYLRYINMFIIILKGFLVYVADLWTAVSLIVIGNTSVNDGAAIPPEVSRWIFLGAITISFILLFWDIRKARVIIESRDISYAFTSVIANRWYSAKDYRYFCLFQKINNSRKRIDSIAFFVFFTLKGWKRLLLAEAPRQVINIVSLYTMIPNWIQIRHGLKIEKDALGTTIMQKMMTGTMAFSVIVFAISFVLVCIAAIIYIPLLCHIQGNLKEYCCHKVDKRIAELLKKQARKRVEKNMKHGQKDNHQQHNRKKKEDIEMQSLAQPTLPQVNMDNLNSGYPHAAYYYPSPQQPHVRPVYHHQASNDHKLMMQSPYVRRNSLSSVNSDQAGLISHAQGQPTSSPFYQGHNGSNMSIHQHYHQPQPHYHSQQQQPYIYSQNRY